jgi:hypothetical protein
MGTDRLQRLFPLSGALFAVTMAVGLTLTHGEPDNSTAAATLYSYWHAHYGVELVSSLVLIPVGIVCLLVFSAELRRTLRSCEAVEAVYSPIALAGGVLAAAGLGVTATLGAAVVTTAHHNDREATYVLAQLQSYDWVPWMVGFAVLFLAVGIGGLRTAALPRPLTISATILGVACITPIGIFALFVIPLWMLAASLFLFLRRRPARRPLGKSATQLA